MFKKNDESLIFCYKLCKLNAIIFAVIGMIAGLVLLTNGSPGGVVFLILSPLFAWISWQFAKLFFTYMIDVKLIRNKLYDQDNRYLMSFENLNDKVEKML